MDDPPVISLSSSSFDAVAAVGLSLSSSVLIIEVDDDDADDDDSTVSDAVIFCLLASGEDGDDDTGNGRVVVGIGPETPILRAAAPGTSTASLNGMRSCCTSHSTAHLAA